MAAKLTSFKIDIKSETEAKEFFANKEAAAADDQSVEDSQSDTPTDRGDSSEETGADQSDDQSNSDESDQGSVD